MTRATKIFYGLRAALPETIARKGRNVPETLKLQPQKARRQIDFFQGRIFGLQPCRLGRSRGLRHIVCLNRIPERKVDKTYNRIKSLVKKKELCRN